MPKVLWVEGQSGSTAFKDTQIKGEYVGTATVAPDTVEVTVFEISLTGFFGGANGTAADQHDDNEARHTTSKGSSDKNGRISWNDTNGDGQLGGMADEDNNCEFFRHAMETQGTVKPGGVQELPNRQIPFFFKFQQERWGAVWTKKGNDAWKDTNPMTSRRWVMEDVVGHADRVPDNPGLHIYLIDSPGRAKKTRDEMTDYWAQNGKLQGCGLC